MSRLTSSGDVWSPRPPPGPQSSHPARPTRQSVRPELHDVPGQHRLLQGEGQEAPGGGGERPAGGSQVGYAEFWYLDNVPNMSLSQKVLTGVGATKFRA